MNIKDLFSKLIKDPTTRKDVEAMISGKGKILHQEAFDERGKPYDKYVPLESNTEIDVEEFRQFNLSNMQRNIAESLYKYYKQKQKDIYKKYVKSITTATEFYNDELDRVYGQGFSGTFKSLKEKETAYVKMKSIIDSGIAGQNESAQIKALKDSPQYKNNQREYDKAIQELEKIKTMNLRNQFYSFTGEDNIKISDIKDQMEDMSNKNEMIINHIKDIREKNMLAISSIIENSLGSMDDLMMSLSDSKLTGAEYYTNMISESMHKLDVGKDASDLKTIIEQSKNTIELLQSIEETINMEIDNINPLIREVEKKKEILKVMQEKKASKKNLSKKEKNAIGELKASIKATEENITDEEMMEYSQKSEEYANIRKGIKEVRRDVAGKGIDLKSDEFKYSKADFSEVGEVISEIVNGSIVSAVREYKKSIGQETKIEEESSLIESARNKINESTKSQGLEQQVNVMNNQIGKIEGTILKPSEYIEQMMKGFGSYMLRIRMVQRGIQDIVDAISEFQKIDDEAFQLGMVSDMNIGSIRKYRNEVLGLASDYRTTAEEIISAQSEVIKSGRTFEQAKQQISASLILARATFEDLNTSSEVMNKLMLTLEINGVKSYETMKKLYNVVQNTPASMSGIEASMRQSSAAFSGLLDEIDYSGTQLEEYKGQLRDAELSLIGFVNLQGKTPQMAGTAVKTLVDKMRSPTTKAKEQINLELAKTNATYEGKKVTSEFISNLTETNFNEAINLLSKLYVNGNLTYQAIQDMFGPRNAATLSKLLYQVNGDLIKSSGDMLTKLDPVKDSEKLMKSWSEEMEELKNSFRALKGIANDFGDALLPVISISKDAISSIAKTANENVLAKSALQVGAVGYTGGKLATNLMLSAYSLNQSDIEQVSEEYKDLVMMGNIFKNSVIEDGKFSIDMLVTSLKSLKDKSLDIIQGIWSFVTSPIGAALIGISVGITALVAAYKYYKENMSEANQASSNAIKSIEERKQALDAENDIMSSLTKTMESLNPASFKTADSIGLLNQEIKNMLDMTMLYTSKLSAFSEDLWKKSMEKEIEQAQNDTNLTEDDKEKLRAKRKALREFNISNIPSEAEMNRIKQESVGIRSISSGEYISGTNKNREMSKEDIISLMKDIGVENIENIINKYYNKNDTPGSSFSSLLRGKKEINESLKNKNLKFDYSFLSGEMKLMSTKSDIDLGSSLKEYANNLEAQIDIYSKWQQNKTANIESINSAIAKEVKQIQDSNNYINTIILDKQKSIFLESGDILSKEDRMYMFSKDSKIKEILTGQDTEKYISQIQDMTNKDAMAYFERLSLILENEETMNERIKGFSDILGQRKGDKEGKQVRTIGKAKEVDSIVKGISSLYTSETDFEKETGISTTKLRDIVKTSDSKNIQENIIKTANKNKKTVSDEMIKVLGDYIKTNGTQLDKSIKQGYIYSNMLGSLDYNKKEDMDKILQTVKSGKFDKMPSVIVDMYINTINDNLAEQLGKYLIDMSLVSNFADIASARVSKKELSLIPIMKASNDMQASMDKLALAHKNKLDEINNILNNATIKVNNTILSGYVGAKESESKMKLAQIKQSFISENITTQATAVSYLPSDITNKNKERAIRGAYSGYEKFNELLKSKKGKVDFTDEELKQIDSTVAFGKYKYDIESYNEKSKEAIAEKTLSDLFNTVNSYINEEGIINKSKLEALIKSRGADNATLLNSLAANIQNTKRAIYDDLEISPAKREQALKESRIMNQEYALKNKYAQLETPENQQIISLFRDYETKSSKNYELENQYKKVKETLLSEKGKDLLKGSFEEQQNAIMKSGLNETAKSEMLKYISVLEKASLDEKNANIELIEKFKELNNSLSATIYEINQQTGVGDKYNKSEDINDLVKKYNENKIEISNIYQDLLKNYSNITMTLKENGEYETTAIDSQGNRVSTKQLNDAMLKIKEFGDANKKISVSLKAYIDANVQKTSEFDFQTKYREFQGFDAKATLSNMSNAERIYGRNNAIYEQRLSAKNAYLQSFNDILSPLSQFPSVQKEITNSQIEILKNTEAEIKTRRLTLTRDTDIVDLKKIEVQLLAATIDKEKEVLQLRINNLEDEKKLFNLRKENYGLINNKSFTPEKNYIQNIAFAKEQLQITLEQIKIEQEANAKMKDQIISMGSLKKSIDSLIKTINPDYTNEEKDNTKLSINKSEVDITKFSGKTEETTDNIINKFEEATKNLINTVDTNTNLDTTNESTNEVIIKEEEKINEDIINNYKQRIAFEQYINDVYKARAEYAKEIDDKYGTTIDNIESLITGNFANVKQEPISMRKAVIGAFEAYQYGGYGGDKKAREDLAGTKYSKFMEFYTGDEKLLKDITGKEKKDYSKEQQEILDKIANKTATKEDKANADIFLKNAIDKKTSEEIKSKIESSYSDVIISTINTISKVLNTIELESFNNKLEGLKLEEKILNARKEGYRTESAKRMIEEEIYQNKLAQIDAQYKIDKANESTQSSAIVSTVGSTLVSTGNPYAMAAGTALQLASPYVSDFLGLGTADMEKAQAKADLESEKNYKQYNEFWNLFFNTIKNITTLAEQRISGLISDYSSGRNQQRLNYGIAQQEQMNQAAIDALNDFQGLGTYTESYKKKNVLGKVKWKDIKTAMTYAFEDMSLTDMKSMVGMSDEELKSKMLYEMQKDNTVDVGKYATNGSGVNKAANAYISAYTLGLSGGDIGQWKYSNSKWEILDSDVEEFRQSLLEAIDAIEYLSREMNSISDRIFYSDKEGYSSIKQSDITAQYTELIANAKTAGNDTLVLSLQQQYEAAMKQFVDGNTSEIFYSTFSSIILEAAKKVSKESGKFSDAYATAIGEAFGVQFGNIISEIINDTIIDNSAIDTYMEDFANKLKDYSGNISDFIDESGVFDIEGISSAIGSGSFYENITLATKALNELSSIDMYATSQSVSDALRKQGLSENQIASFLSSAGLTDILGNAISSLADTANPLKITQAQLTLEKESFSSKYSDIAEEIRRKTLSGIELTFDEEKAIKEIESGELALAIKENVLSGFENGIKGALSKSKYSDIFSEFGNVIGEQIQTSILASIDYSSQVDEIKNKIASGDYSTAGALTSQLSISMMNESKKMQEYIKSLRNSGMDWTEIESLGLSSNDYSSIESILSGNEVIKNSIAKYEKELYNYNNTMANDKYTSEEYYTELNKRIANNEILSDIEKQWYTDYEEGLDIVIQKQSLLNKLSENLSNILSNSSAVGFMKSVGASLGTSINDSIISSIKVDDIMQSIVEKSSVGDSISKEISSLSDIYNEVSVRQKMIKQQMILDGNSYTMIESIFGEDATSKIADIYVEMERYSDLLANVTKRELDYKESIKNVNGVQYTYEEYYRELALKKANNIELTKQETEWMKEYSNTIQEFNSNSTIITEFYSALTSSFSKTTNQEIFDSFASGFVDSLQATLIDGYLEGQLSDDMSKAISLAQSALSSGSVSDLYSAQQKLIQLSAQIQTTKQQSQGLIDMFDSTKLIDFTDKTKDIQYTASSSKDVTYNITQNLTLQAGSVIGDNLSLEKLAKVLAPMLKPELAKIK